MTAGKPTAGKESAESMMNRKDLRARIAARDLLVMPGVFDGFSAHLVERGGYEAALITGAGVSESRYGQPDVGLVGAAETVEVARVLAGCGQLCLIADADTGYGNAVNVHFIIRALERAGVAGVMLEDQVWPKRCGHMAGKEVIPAEEMVEKVRAAVEARRDPDLIIKARTDAAGPLGIGEAIRRANLYAEAGADLLFADALLSEEDIRQFAAEVSGPVAVNMGFGIRSRATTPLLSMCRLAELGVTVVDLPRMLTAAAVRGMMQALTVFGEAAQGDDVVDRPDLLVSFEELNDLVGLPQVRALEERYRVTTQSAER